MKPNIIISLLLLTVVCTLHARRNWDISPSNINNNIQYGIIMGASSNYFKDNSLNVQINVCIAKIYAKRHNYAFYLEKNLEEIATIRTEACPAGTGIAWNKIKLMQSYLDDVEYLLWIDIDAIIVRMNSTIDRYTHHGRRRCIPPDVTNLGTKLQGYTQGSVRNPFLWLSSDVNKDYAVNLNSAVVLLKRTPIAFEFLSKVWNVTKDEYAFTKHDPYWKQKVACMGYYGWPWEQGAIWDILSDQQDQKFLQSTCILPNKGSHGFNSVLDTYHSFPNSGTPFILHHHEHIPRLFQTFLREGIVSNKEVEDVCGFDPNNLS
jgi:hypothetical protein